MQIEDLIPEGFRGNILLTGKQIKFLQSYGYADLMNQIPNTSDTKFATASAGKAFVAVGILQLIEKGLLHFEDTLGQILDIDLREIDPNVTIHQLLNHTSGVPDYFDESIMDEYEDLWIDFPNYKIRHNSDLLPLFIDKPMMYPKGERFQYNNSGYVLLAMVIEQVTGLPFDLYLKANVFAPCGMENTGYYELDRLPAKCAQNYIYCSKTDDYRTNIFSVDVKGTGAGGAFTTVCDIERFWNGLIRFRLLPETLVRQAFQVQAGDGKSSEEGYYGYGFWIIKSEDGSCIPYFQGCDPGVSFLSEYNPQNGQITVLVSNYCDNVWQIMRAIRKSLYGQREAR